MRQRTRATCALRGAVDRFPHSRPAGGRGQGTPTIQSPSPTTPPSVAPPLVRRPRDRDHRHRRRVSAERDRGTARVAPQSPSFSRVVRLLSSATADPRLPTFPLARSVPGLSGDTRPFPRSFSRKRSGSGSPWKFFAARLHVSHRRCARHPLTALVITGFYGGREGAGEERAALAGSQRGNSEFYRANRPPGGNWKLDYSGNNWRATALLGIVRKIENRGLGDPCCRE